MYTTDAKTLERLQENKERSGLPIDFYYLGGGDKNNADRGGAPQQVSLKTLEKCLATKGPVTVIPGRADLMFNAITDEQAALFPTWEKDLLLIQHSTGVLTSMGYTKKLNRDAEILANAAERAAVSAHLFSKAVYPAGQLQKGWELVLRNHFHDTLPATSIPIAHEYAWNDGIIALNQFSGVYADSVGSLSRLK
ncbi:MAG: alpha-mannosidase, partial [Kiritimatiellaceae bacterium]|nr:alpha-mannosidase [Kiritimatiellaceae bacterium]